MRLRRRIFANPHPSTGSGCCVLGLCTNRANVAEGYCRNALGDYIRFCEIARGSLGELGSQIQDCERWGLVKGDDLEQVIRLFGDATYFLEQLIEGLRAKRKDGTWDRSMGVKEQTVDYVTEDADLPFTLPETDDS
jgi:hypothetical protein